MRDARRIVLFCAALCGVLSCQQADSVVIVSVYWSGTAAIDQLRALMSNGVATSTKLFPERATVPFAFTPAVTFAVVVPRARTGAFDIAVDGLSAGTVVANGAARAILNPGGRTDVSMNLVPGMSLCGNGRPDPGEQCDYGDRFSGNGCDLLCQLEAGGGGAGGGAARGGAGGEAGRGGAGVAGAGEGGGAAGGERGGGGAGEGGGAAGGAPGMGGAGGTPVASGGTNGSGGRGSGGTSGTGGAGTGGTVASTGGAPGTGGAPATGGAPGTGGTPATGGAPGTGGTAGITGAGGAGATGGAPIDPALEVWYRFDDGTGTSAIDGSGKGRTGTLVSVSPGTASFSPTAEIGSGAVDLTGQSTTGGGYVLIPGSLGAMAPDAVTIACWVNLRTNAAEARVFDFGVDANTSMFLTPRHSGLLPLGSSDLIEFQIMRGTLSQQSIQSASAFPSGGWHHVAVVLRSGSPYTGALYVDGALSGMNTNMTLHASDLGVTINNWLGRSTSSASDPFLDGLLDDFRLYSRALADSEIAVLYQSGTTNR